MNLLSVILLQAYWLSYSVIGVAVLAAYTRRYPSAFLRKQPALCLVSLAFTAGFSASAVPVVLSYIFVLPTCIASTLYVAVLASSIAYLALYRQRLVRVCRRLIAVPRSEQIKMALTLLALAAVYFLFVRTHGGLTESDAGVHIARINQIRQGYFSLADPFMGNHGIVDPRYSTNLLLGLAGMGAYLLHMPALQLWILSMGYYVFVLWLSVYLLFWNILQPSVRQNWSSVIAVSGPFIFFRFFRYIEFPDRIVFMWIGLVMLGLQRCIQYRERNLLLLAVSLIAVTHSLYSLMTLGFIVFLLVILLVTRQIRRREVITLGLAILILAAPVLLTLHYPNLTSTNKFAFNAGTISGQTFMPRHYGPFFIEYIPSINFVTLFAYATALGALCLMKLTQRRALRGLLACIAAIIFVLNFDTGYIGAIGIGVLMKQVASKKLRLLVGALVLYYLVVVYNPVLVPLIHTKVPPWVVSRFQELNIFSLFAVPVAVLMFYKYISHFFKGAHYKALIAGSIVLVYVFVLPMVIYRPTLDPSLLKEDKTTKHITEPKILELEQLTSLRGQTIYTNSLDQGFYIPSAVDGVRTVVTLDTNYAPMANIALRDACGVALEKNLELSDLRAAAVTRVIADRVSNRWPKLPTNNKPYLAQVQQTAHYTVYAVDDRTKVTARGSACSIPYGE